MRRLLALAALALAGCDALDRRAMVMPLAGGLEPEVVLSSADGIASPDGLKWENGRLLIADEGGSAIRVWTPGGKVETLADAEDGLRSPEDLARGRDGALYASDDDAGGIWRVGADGAVSHHLRQVRSSEGLGAAADGSLILGDGGSGRILPLGARVAKPEGFAPDGRGNLWIADNDENVLYLRTADGALHRPLAERSGFSPESLHHDGEALLITDSAHGRLYRYTPEDGLETIALFAGELANVQGVTTDDAGNIYVSVQSDLKGRRGYVLRLKRAAP